MTTNGIFQFLLYLMTLIVLSYPLGKTIARIYRREYTFLDPVLRPLECLLYKFSGVHEDDEMDWKQNAIAMLVFNCAGFLVVYAIQRLQIFLPLNPQNMGAISPDSSLNTAMSFTSNTNWQGYSSEATMSYFTQMAALTVQNFLSAATGMAILVLIIRGISRHSTTLLGNFWVDMTRSVLYILLPLSLILSIALVSQGVIQNISPYQSVRVLDSPTDSGLPQLLPMGPAASQIAIKQIGTNGGGFFNSNSAHPFENPTPISNFLEMISILLLAAAFCFTYGSMVKDMRQGWAIFSAMMLIFIVFSGITVWSEQQSNPKLSPLNIDQSSNAIQSGGNMEGKEVRFGIVNSALWATATTAASNGSVNAMHDSFTPMGGFVTLFMMQLGEVIFGGVGSGLYGMLIFIIVAVFVSGLLVGRTPEYLGHKIEVYEIKMASLVILIMPITVLVLTALALSTASGKTGIFNPGIHGFSEVLYLFTSQGNNNGSAFAGISSNTPFYNYWGAVAMLIGRYWLAIPALALAGSLATKKPVPQTESTLPTHTPLFIFWLIAIIIIVGALNFLPALALGPIVEHLSLMQ